MSHSEAIRTIFPQESAIPERFRFAGPVCQTEYLVNGELREWTGPWQEIESPVCVQTSEGCARVKLGRVPLQGEKEALDALDAAVQAFDNGRGRWPTLRVSERIRHMEQFAFCMKGKREEVTKLIMWEIGKTLPDAEKEFDRTLEYIQDTIDALKDLDRVGARFSISQGIIGQIRRAPLGVVLCMGPYNYPLNETYTILIPALIMGNTVVFKPPKLGVLLHRPLLEALRDSFPPGVVNTVYGHGAEVAGPLMKSGKVDVLGFIGSSGVADTLKDQHPRPHRLRSVLGLGAKNAAIILPSADLDLTVKECVLGTLSYNGQRCTALKILFVHRQVAEEFLSRYCRAVEQLVWGMPWGDKVQITPLPVPGKPEYLAALAEDAGGHGAHVLNEGGALVNETFFSPGVLFPVTDQMRICHEEQFGPLIPVVSFDDVQAPVRWVEQSCYGQQVSLFGADPDALARLIDPLVNQVCRVNLNSQCQRGPDTFPFTGRKDSAEGTLSVSDALRVFSIRTLVAAKSNDINKSILSDIVRNRKSNFLSTDFIF